MARLFVIIGGLLVLLLTGALVAPYFIDWTSYRSDFEAAATQALGRDVHVTGKASARLLPFPSVTFDDVLVGDDAESPDMTIEKFSMDAELAPFLRGEVLIFDMRVTKPRVFAQIGKTGIVNWVLRPQPPKGFEQITLESVSIEDGAVEIDDLAAGRLNVIEQINAKVSAKTLAGPWRFSSNLVFNEEPMALSGSTGQADGDGKMPLRLSVSPANRSMLAETEGMVSLTKGSPAYEGNFTLRPAGLTDPGAVSLRDGEGASTGAPIDGPAFNITGKFSAIYAGVTLPAFRFETGPRDNPYFAEGSGSVVWGREPRFDFTAKGAQVNIGEGGGEEADGKARAGLSARLAALEAFLAKIPLPHMPGQIKVDLPAVLAGDTTIRDVAFSASPKNNAWELSNFTATLPGRTSLEANGRIGLGKDFGFSGKLVVASSQPSGFAAWLAGDAIEPVRHISKLGFEADVKLAKGSQIFENLEIAIGATSLKGRLERHDEGAVPSVSTALTAGALDEHSLAAMFAVLKTPANRDEKTATDVDITLRAGPVSAFGLEVASVDMAVRLKGEKLDIDRFLVSGPADSSLSATADLRGYPSAVHGTIDASLLSPDGGPLFARLAESLPNVAFFPALAERSLLYPDLFSDTKVDLVASVIGTDTKDQEATISLSASAGDGIYSASATVKGDFHDWNGLSGKLSAEGRHDDPLAIMALAGIAALPMSVQGPASFAIAADGSYSGGFSLTSSVAAEGIDGSLSGTFANGGAGLAGDGELALKATDIEPYLMAASIVLPGLGQGLSVDMKSGFSAAGNRIDLTALEGVAAGVGISGAVSLEGDKNTPKIGGSIALDSVDFGWLAEGLLGAGGLAENGKGWSAAEFANEGMIGLQGALALTAKSGDLRGLGVAENLAANIVLQDNGIRLENLRAQFGGGALNATIDAKNDKGTAFLTGDFTLSGADIAKLLPQQAVNGTIDLSGTVSSTGRSADALAASLAGTGIANLHTAVVSGINPAAFGDILALANATENVPGAAALDALLASKIRTGFIAVKDADMTWTLASGVARFSPLISAVEGGILSADGVLDIGRLTARLDGQFAYDPGINAVTGADPVVPFSATLEEGAISVKFDSGPLGQFLTQRALEREQARVEAMQEELLEGQRLRREVRLYASLADARERKELDLLRAAEELRVRGAVKDTQRRLEEKRAQEETDRLAKAAEAQRRQDEAVKKAAEAALAQRPVPAKQEQTLPQLKVNPQDFQQLDSAGGLLNNLDLQAVPIQ